MSGAEAIQFMLRQKSIRLTVLDRPLNAGNAGISVSAIA
jgi:hypothetical protein